MNKLLRIIIVLWAAALIAIAAYPPWTVKQTLYLVNPSKDPFESHTSTIHYDATTTQFRSFLAPTKWLGSGPNAESTNVYNGVLRFDLLALEMLMVSVAAAALLIVTKKGGGR